MAHIHTQPGQIDFCVNVYVVYQNKVLLRMHDKYHVWLPPGGHIELDEVPEEAVLREVKEEVGLDVTLWSQQRAETGDTRPLDVYRELIPPYHMNIHRINDEHRHIELAYFATSATDVIREPDDYEKSGGCQWLTREELLEDAQIVSATKVYCLKALELLGTS